MEQLVKLLCDQKQARPGQRNPPACRMVARKSAVTLSENSPAHSKPPADDHDPRWHLDPHPKTAFGSQRSSRHRADRS